MADLIGIGVSGLSAYQRALATTSNNIANLQTEGYVRQRAVLASSGQDPSAIVSVGTGVRFAEIQRLYDRFAEENLQRATSGLEAEQGMLKELQALQDAIGSSEAGLHGAFQDFFDSARELEASPASAGARAGFLAKSEGLAARFRSLASTAARLDIDSRAQVEQALQEANTLLSQLASLNTQLLKRSSASEQPMQLLDQRDNAIRELSKKIGVTVVLTNSGSANIYAGESASGVALVEDGRSRTISASFDSYDYGKAEFVLDAASQPVVLPSVKTGLVGGLVAFRSQGLRLAVDKLDELALSFGRAVNKLHREGLDASGRPGEDLFYVGPRFVVDGKANGGSARLGVEVIDPENVKSSAYEMTFNASSGSWTVKELSSGRTATGTTTIELDGLRFAIEGTPRNGDTFRISPEDHPAATFSALIKDGSQVASAGRFAIRADISNLGASAAEMTITEPRASVDVRSIEDILPSPKTPVGEETFTATGINAYQDTIIAARTGPIAVIPAGYTKIALTTAIGEGSELAVFTRDGRQIAGPAMDSNIVKEAYGFYSGATYSDLYLNQTGEDAYLDLSFNRGVYAESGSQVDVDGNVILSPARIYGEAVTGTAAGTQTLRINNQSVPVTLSETPATSLSNVVGSINDTRALTGVAAQESDGKLVLTAFNDVRFDVGAVDVTTQDKASIEINGGEYTVGFRLRISDKALTGNDYLYLNGEKFTFSSLNSSATGLTKLINDKTSLGVQAAYSSSSGEIVLTVKSDNARIKIGRNTLGLAERDDAYLLDNGSLTAKKASDTLVGLINAGITRPDGTVTPNGLVAKGGLLSTGLNLTISASADTTDAYVMERTNGGSYLTDGFKVGDVVRISAGGVSASSKTKSIVITDLSATKLTGKVIDGSTLAEETATGCTVERGVQLTNAADKTGESLLVGANTLGLESKAYFNNGPINVDIAAGAPRSVFGSLGLRSGFVMDQPIAEDLLVFGVNKDGGATKVSLSGTYSAGEPPAELKTDARTYSLEFTKTNYRLIDTATNTEVSSGVFDTTSRTIRYDNWSITLKNVPAEGDRFTIARNDDAMGDNRMISLIAQLQFDRDLLPSKQTVQQEYEDLVNRVGVLTVQAEVGRDAQKVVFDQARENRDRVSGVNLDEELSDLLRYQQAYQANAQVIQTATRLFDTLMQRL
jgi:flagellar hook-associated protein FlgK